MNIYDNLNMDDCEISLIGIDGKESVIEKITENRRRKCFGQFYSTLKDQRFEKDDNLGDVKSMKSVYLYTENFDKMLELHKGLMIYGDVGVGKSFAAACAANAVIDKGYKCRMTDFSRIINTLWGMTSGKQEYIDELNSPDLLVIDDLGAERDTEYSNEIVMNVINARCRTGKPLIVTTNIVPKEFSDIKKQRIYSRLYEMCIPINFKGQDRRQHIMAEDYMQLKNLLELPI